MTAPMDLWRIELLHPVTVHFPIAFLLGAAAIMVVSLGINGSELKQQLRFCSKLLLFFGVCGAWIAIWSGGLAESIVNRVICDPEVTHRHAEWAERATYVFTGAFFLWIGLDKYNAVSKRMAEWIIASILLLGAAGLVYAAYLGGELVYQQGAAVYRTTEQCVEFE